MIEVEQKFLVSPVQLDLILAQSEFVKESVFIDIYYDTPDWSLTKSDVWLRQRGGTWELKVPLDGVSKDKATNHYEEIQPEQAIRDFLQLTKQGDLWADLLNYNYRPFCQLETTRRKYQQAEFIIDVDVVRASNFHYALMEVELLVDDVKELAIAKDKILTWAKDHNLELKPIYGKVIAYLQQEKPEHFQALVDSGTIRLNN